MKSGKYDADEALRSKCAEALKQIDDKQYIHELRDSPLPIYKIGIACHGKSCLVNTVLYVSQSPHA
ncbi:MAG: PD-(D/E)XK nuclease domain-containing protein [Oscillospiraceae bacterium]|nr:PD-(D/E)XK nuclease domain-containing protein [Oscillospiraceae bacterium]